MSSNKEKIAIYHNLPGGGSVRVLQETIKHLSKKYEVNTFSITEKSESNWKKTLLKHKEIEIKVTPWPGFLLRNLWMLLVLPNIHSKLAKIIDKKKYKILLVHPDSFTKAPYILRYTKTQSIYFLNEPPREFYEPSYFHTNNLKQRIANILRFYLKIVDRNSVLSADKIVVNSYYTQKLVEKIYQRKSKILYPGVDVNKFKPQKGVHKQGILSIGGLSKIKGHDFVVNAVRKILDEKHTLTILGDGSQEDIERITKISKEKIKFVKIISKHVNDTQLIKIYSKNSILCIGAFKEPFGLTSIESQSCGTPVVAIDEGGIGETIVNNKSGILVDRNIDQFTIAVKKVINSDKFKINARKNAIKNWPWKNSLKKLDQIISNK